MEGTRRACVYMWSTIHFLFVIIIYLEAIYIIYISGVHSEMSIYLIIFAPSKVYAHTCHEFDSLL